jgi:hypothetical protein
MRSVPFVFWLVAGCGGPSDKRAASPSPAEESAHGGDDQEPADILPPQPSWDADEVRSAVQAALDRGIP